jgi:hypothetical protein
MSAFNDDGAVRLKPPGNWIEYGTSSKNERLWLGGRNGTGDDTQQPQDHREVI